LRPFFGRLRALTALCESRGLAGARLLHCARATPWVLTALGATLPPLSNKACLGVERRLRAREHVLGVRARVLAAFTPPSVPLRSLDRGKFRASHDKAGRRCGSDAHSAPGYSGAGQQGGDRSNWAFAAAFAVGAVIHQVCACRKESTGVVPLCDAFTQHELVFLGDAAVCLRLVAEKPKFHLTSCTALQMQAPAGCEGDHDDDEGSAGGSHGDEWGERVGVRADLVGGIGGWEANAEPEEKPADKPADEGTVKSTKDPNKVINIEQGASQRAL